MKQEYNKLSISVVCAVLALITLVAFEQVSYNDFVYDDIFVTKNQNINSGVNYKAFVWAFKSMETSNWIPLTWLSHMVDCHLFGLNPRGHHLVNLLFHTANALLLFWILNKMTGQIWLSAFTAAIFAIHPLRVESVAWVAERKDVLSGFFFMLTLVAYAWYVEHPRITRYLLVALAFSLGLMAKPMLVVVPFVLLLLDYWPLGRFQKRPKKSEQASLTDEFPKLSYRASSVWHLILEKIPLLVFSAASSVVAFVAQRGAGAMKPGSVLSLDFRIFNALVSYIRYIGKMFYPRNLAVLYLHPRGGWPQWQVVACLAVLVVVSIVAICTVRKGYLAVGWFWYLGALVPVIGLVQVGAQAMADRYTYLPSIGINIMIIWGAADIFARQRYRKIWLTVLGGTLIIVLLVCTRMQVRYWQNELTLFGHAAEATENNYVMHANYGVALRKNNQFEEAIRHSSEALRISPKNYRPLENIALSYYMLGEIDQAICYWYKALKFDSDWISVLNSLSWVLSTAKDEKLRNPAKAVKFAERACELTDYKNAESMDTLAAAYALAGQFSLAVKTAERAVKLAESADMENLAQEIRERLELYKASRSYHEK